MGPRGRVAAGAGMAPELGKDSVHSGCLPPETSHLRSGPRVCARDTVPGL